MTSNLVKPSASQTQAPARSQLQAPTQAQIQPPASAQPPRLAPAYFPQLQAAPPRWARHLPSESLHDEDRLSDFPESKAFLIAEQARSKLLDQVANFCQLERGETEDQRKSILLKRPTHHDLAIASINVPWHSVAQEIADLNFHIVTGKLNKRMKSCHPARPWFPKDFFSGIGYHTHNLEGCVLKPESLVLPSRPPPRRVNSGGPTIFPGSQTS